MHGSTNWDYGIYTSQLLNLLLSFFYVVLNYGAHP